MEKILKNIQGDLTIWAIVLALAIFSFLPIYSASTNLVYVASRGTTEGYLFKHFMLLVLGFAIIYGTHKIPYKYFSIGSVIMLPLVIVLLVYTLAKGTVIGGANASRWIKIPVVGISFQTSTLAGVVLMMYVSRYMAKHKEKVIDFKHSLIYLWLPVASVLVFILPANFSTTALIFLMISILTYVGGYPIKQLGAVIGLGAIVLTFFIAVVLAFPESMPNRVSTWKSRIENFASGDKKEAYQVEKAKISIASGMMFGEGFGKSKQKNFLPQSSSDFIYAIIIEETGLIGGILIMGAYFLLLFRFIVVARNAPTIFSTLLVVGVGMPVVFQALINMAVAVNLMPVTGQTLPLISSGGTSIWMTCLSVGVVLSVSATSELLPKKRVKKARVAKI